MYIPTHRLRHTKTGAIPRNHAGITVRTPYPATAVRSGCTGNWPYRRIRGYWRSSRGIRNPSPRRVLCRRGTLSDNRHMAVAPRGTGLATLEDHDVADDARRIVHPVAHRGRGCRPLGAVAEERADRQPQLVAALVRPPRAVVGGVTVADIADLMVRVESRRRDAVIDVRVARQTGIRAGADLGTGHRGRRGGSGLLAAWRRASSSARCCAASASFSAWDLVWGTSERLHAAPVGAFVHRHGGRFGEQLAAAFVHAAERAHGRDREASSAAAMDGNDTTPTAPRAITAAAATQDRVKLVINALAYHHSSITSGVRRAGKDCGT